MKRSFISLLVLILSLFASAVYAQQPVFRHYSVDDGLPSNEIYHVFQDSKGYIWLATNMGVSRYDGRTFRNFDKQDGLPENTVFEIYEDKKGRIWFVSFPCQLSYFYADSIISYDNNSALRNFAGNGLIPVKKSFQVKPDGRIYISFLTKGLIEISRDGHVKRINEPGYLQNGLNLIEIEGNLLISQVGGMVKFLKVKIKTALIDTTLSLKSSSNYSYSNIYASTDPDNNIYYSQNEHLSKVCKDGKKFEHDFISRVIWIDYQESDKLWVGTDKSGVYCFARGRIDEKPVSHFLEGYSVTSVMSDNEGGQWFSTIENGLFYLASLNFKSYKESDGLSNNKVNAIALQNHKIVAGTNDQYINIIDESGVEVVKISESMNGLILEILSGCDGTLYIGTNDYLYLLKNDVIRKVVNENYATHITDISRRAFSIKDLLLDSKGRLVAGESRGLSIIEGDKVLYNSYYKVGLDIRVEAIEEIKPDSLLIGSFNGLWSYSNGRFHHLISKNPIFQQRITDICISADRKIRAYGTKGNGLILEMADSTYLVTKSQGLSSNSITSLVFLNDFLWVATNKGLNCFEPKKIGTKDFKISIYSKRHGLISNEINQIVGDDKHIYIATNQGLTVFNYQDYQPVSVPPPVFISSFRIMNSDTIVRSGYRLKNEENFIAIQFIGISYRDSENIKYRYRLIGLNDTWTSTFNNEVQYAFLPAGSYTFEVIATNSDGIESKTPAQISFIILPPFWKTWWFISIVVMVIVLLIYFYYINRVKQLRNEHELRNDINWYRQQALGKQMDPHFVFNTLNSIQSYIIKNDRLASSQYLSKFAKLMRLILNSSQKQAVPLSDEISALSLYLELESLRFQQKFNYKLEIDNSIDSLACFIPPFLIQPFVENAIWHGIMGLKVAGCINIFFVKNQNQITCTIEDNGIGRERAMAMKTENNHDQKSLGITLVESRLNLLNSLYGIDMHVHVIDLFDSNSEPAGTKVVINLPLIT